MISNIFMEKRDMDSINGYNVHKLLKVAFQDLFVGDINSALDAKPPSNSSETKHFERFLSVQFSK